MASISAPTFPSPSTRSEPNPHRFSLTLSKISSHLKPSPQSLNPRSLCGSASHSLSSRVPDTAAALCRCRGSDSGESSDESWRWDSAIQHVFRNVMRRLDDFVRSHRESKVVSVGTVEKGSEVLGESGCDDEWDWDRWRKHFDEIDEQERIVSILKSQLAYAVKKEDYEDAAQLKVAIAAATANDAVGRVMSQLNKALEDERYCDAASMRDSGGTGLVGWWAGISDDKTDPYGRIIRISAEHGRYVARSYSPRQLATATSGAPLFEIYVIMNRKGEYKQQAVYLKRTTPPQDLQVSSKSSVHTSSLNPLDKAHNKVDLFGKSSEDKEDDENMDDDSDAIDGPFAFESILRDIIPGVKVEVLKVTAPGKVDKDLISKVIDQMMEEEDEEKDSEIGGADVEDETQTESDDEDQNVDAVANNEIIEPGEQRQLAVKVVIGDLTQNVFGRIPQRELIRVRARLEKKGRVSFSFSVEKEKNHAVNGCDGESSPNKKAKLQSQRSLDHVMFDLARFIGRGKIPMKVLKDVSNMINITLKQTQNYQPLSGSTTFSRIEVPTSSDPLNGLYIGGHGMYTSEVIHLRRKFGQWQGDDNQKKNQNLEFYEYVEAVKLTGDPYVPAGQVSFRAKVGKRYMLPHKGIIPEEFGVIARYKGQGRLAELGYRNPRWVDGELVILDGKFIKAGPVVGFVYWAPDYHFLVFFSRLRLQE